MSGVRGLIFMTAVVVVILSAWTALGRAGLDLGPARPPRTEVIVFEHADSVHCRVFRRDVLPKYKQGMRMDVPLRFIDVSTSDTSALGLRAAIRTVPTAVVMRDGREVDRIVGYWGPTNFFIMLSHILATIQ
jgi:thioredoxin-related protein